jgi:LPPG:FO 2-phospho-L-lactate transferase
VSLSSALLCGGLGGARLAPHLAAAGRRLTVVCNVADDLEVEGLHVSPDVDAVLYALAGVFDHDRGYGVRDDTGSFAALAARAGVEGWFHLGDRDLATQVVRTALLRRGLPLSATVAALADGLGVRATVLPSTDDRVRTRVAVSGGELDFQSFYVRHRAAVEVAGVRWEGLAGARPAPGVLEALAGADLVVLAESSPVGSLLPILGLPGVREALAAAPGFRLALSPVIAAVPPTSAADRHHWEARGRLLRAVGRHHDPASVADLYRGLVDAFVLDRRDADFGPDVALTGATVVEADLLDRSGGARGELARLLAGLAARRPAVGRPVPEPSQASSPQEAAPGLG